MDSPVHYRGYDILCSERGYTILFNDVDVMTEGVEHAGELKDCRDLEIILEQARRAVDQFIAGCSGRSR